MLLAAAAIVAIGLLFLWRVRARPGRAHLFEPPHTPPTVPWRAARRPEPPAAPRGGGDE